MFPVKILVNSGCDMTSENHSFPFQIHMVFFFTVGFVEVVGFFFFLLFALYDVWD